MRQFSAHTLAPLLGVLMAVTMVAACGGDGDSAAPRHGPASSERSTRATEQEVVTADPPTTVPVTEAPAAPADSPGPAAPAPAPAPSGGVCDTAAVHDAIAGSGAVAPDLAFEVTYLECAEGYGWAQVLADFGDGATAFLQGSGSEITVLDLGSAVCPTAAGMPESIAVQLAPAGSAWRGECGPA